MASTVFDNIVSGAKVGWASDGDDAELLAAPISPSQDRRGTIEDRWFVLGSEVARLESKVRSENRRVARATQSRPTCNLSLVSERSLTSFKDNVSK